MNRFLVACFLASLFACGGSDTLHRYGAVQDMDAATPADSGRKPGVCELSKCPTPPMGQACCTPLAQCGMDTTGLGLTCEALPGEAFPGDRVCKLKECPTPTIGSACCTPFATCGFDPFDSGQVCFAFPASTGDAGSPTCDLTKCPEDDAGVAAACCLPNGKCGFDFLGIGLCEAPTPSDAGTGGSMPITYTAPPNDPHITGKCPSYLDDTGPTWGCCSDFGVCGTFEAGACLVPSGTEIPVMLPMDDDAGMSPQYPLCVPPKKK